MSSEISIDAAALKGPKGRAAANAAHPASSADDGLRPWHFFLLSSILLATVAVMLTRQSSPENLILISLTIAAAGAAAAAFYRMLAPLTQDLVLRAGEPVSERARAALEREKMLVLRSIKELEFDRAMGKLSQKDFDEMAGRLRARALTLMRQLDLDASGYKSAIEKEVDERLQRVGPATNPVGHAQTSEANASAVVCRACAVPNDSDAAFCKRCGARLA